MLLPLFVPLVELSLPAVLTRPTSSELTARAHRSDERETFS
jgi:hypothetical protein